MSSGPFGCGVQTTAAVIRDLLSVCVCLRALFVGVAAAGVFLDLIWPDRGSGTFGELSAPRMARVFEVFAGLWTSMVWLGRRVGRCVRLN